MDTLTREAMTEALASVAVVSRRLALEPVGSERSLALYAEQLETVGWLAERLGVSDDVAAASAALWEATA